MRQCPLSPPCDIRAVVIEEELALISAEQNCNVDKFVGLVKENKAVLNKMEVRPYSYEMKHIHQLLP